MGQAGMSFRKPTYEELEQRLQEAEARVRELEQGAMQRETSGSRREESSFFEALFNVIPDVIGIQDSKHTIIRYNEAGYRFLRMPHEEVAGRKCYELIGRDAPCERCATSETYKTRRPAQVETFVDELGVWLDVRSYPILDKEGAIDRVIEHLRDITEEKERESELRASRDLLQKRVEQRTEELRETNDALRSELETRRQTEQRLLASEERFRSVFEGVPTGLYRTDLEGRIVEANPALVQMLGFPDLESLRRTAWTALMVSPETQREMRRALERSGAVQGWEYELYRWDGSTIWVRDSARSVQDAHGRVLYEGSLEDVTQRKRMEDALRENEEKYRTVAENSLSGIFIVQDGRFVFVNQWQAEFLGYDRPEDLEGKPFLALVHPDHRDMVREQSARRLKGEAVPERYEFLSEKKDGTPVWGEVRVALAAYRGRSAIVGNLVDVTERKRAEASRRESEERFRVLFESAPDAYFLHDADGVLIDVNRKAEEVSGYSRDELLGRSMLESPLVASGQGPSVASIIERNRRGQTTGPEELELVRKDGSPLSAEVRTHPIRLQGHTVTMAIVRDISQQKRAEQEAARLEARVQQAQKMEAIGTLAGGIAHDFNNILSAIVGYTEMAGAELPLGFQGREDLDEVLKAASRAKDLVKQILTFSRQSEREVKPLRVDLVVKEALHMLRSSLPSSIEIRQSVDSDLPAVVGDPTQVYQIMMNLCANAAQAIEDEHGSIEVVLDAVRLDSTDAAKASDLLPGPYVRLRVSDTGSGMRPETQERIFDPYFTTKEAAAGTGLGLAVVYGIVKECGGGISVESRPGHGSTFTVYIPATEKEEASSTRATRDHLPSGRERVLFLDDEPAIVALGRQYLAPLGYEVTGSQCPLEALEAFRRDPRHFDVVVTDMTMPHMTGDELAVEMLSIRPDLPIVLCTGYSRRISERRAREMGIRAFVMKPLTRMELARTVRHVLDETPP